MVVLLGLRGERIGLIETCTFSMGTGRRGPSEDRQLEARKQVSLCSIVREGRSRT